jgi:hypothetical protein
MADGARSVALAHPGPIIADLQPAEAESPVLPPARLASAAGLSPSSSSCIAIGASASAAEPTIRDRSPRLSHHPELPRNAIEMIQYCTRRGHDVCGLRR